MREFFKQRKIEYFSAVLLSACKITKKYLLEKANLDENSFVIPFLIPYRTDKKPKNLSVYASVKDYHKYVEILRNEAKEYVKERYPSARFEVFADHSPIDEVHCACISGLGFIGDNGLLINEKYSSFVFLCECITDTNPEEMGIELYKNPGEVKRCIGCGACHRECPSQCMDGKGKSECLSAITQKKGELNMAEIEMMTENGSIWGCDICQNVCPYTKNASYSEIEYFKEDVITELTTERIDKMSDEEFCSRPFSWRGRETVRRNTLIYDKEKGKW